MKEASENSVEKKKSMAPSTDETKSKDVNIKKAIRFWTHPSMQSVPTEEKILYLQSRGLTREDIHQVWEQLTKEQDATDTTADAVAPLPPSNINNEQPPLHSFPPQPQRTLPPQYYPPQHEQQDTGTYSAMDIPALLAIGGALGLTAAAAVRWLNGGDFCLLPPPTITRGECNNNNTNEQNDTSVQQETTRDKEEEVEQQVKEDTRLIFQETNESSSSLQQQPLEQSNEDLRKVLELLTTNFAKQQVLLQQIHNRTNKQVTDDSMNLLRRHDGGSTTRKLQEQPQEIQQQLETISTSEENGSSTMWTRQLEECLTMLKDCIQQISSNPTNENSSNATPILNESSSALPQDTNLPSPPTILPEDCKSISLRRAIEMLAQQNEPASLQAGAQLLYLYVINLSSHPHVPRYQKIFTTNESFQKVRELQGGKELLLAVGFEETGTRLEWNGGSEHVISLKEAAAALSILKTCSNDVDAAQLSSNAQSVLAARPSTPPPLTATPSMSDDFKTPNFIASPPTTKKHPLLDESGEDSILDMSNASEQFKSRLESLAQPVISNDLPMFGNENNTEIPKTNLSMRESDPVEEEERGGTEEEFGSASEEWTKEEGFENKPVGNVDESGDTAELSS